MASSVRFGLSTYSPVLLSVVMGDMSAVNAATVALRGATALRGGLRAAYPAAAAAALAAAGTAVRPVALASPSTAAIQYAGSVYSIR